MQSIPLLQYFSRISFIRLVESIIPARKWLAFKEMLVGKEWHVAYISLNNNQHLRSIYSCNRSKTVREHFHDISPPHKFKRLFTYFGLSLSVYEVETNFLLSDLTKLNLISSLWRAWRDGYHRNGIGDLSSNPIQHCLCFTSR